MNRTDKSYVPQLWYGNMYQEDIYADLRIQKYAKMVIPYLKKGAEILDIGCYTARLYDFLPKSNQIEYWGVDFDEQALSIAKQKGIHVQFVRFDTDPIPLQKQFDIIVAGEVLEHLINPANLMEQMQRLLKSDGIVLISLPNECTLYHRIMCLIGSGVDSQAFQLYKHLHLPTIKQSEQFISKYFNIIKKAYFVNPGGKGSKWEMVGKISSMLPIGFWQKLGDWFPTLFARGTIFLCVTRESSKQ
ncbi:MAG: class I SAM-dependent methyltransferase [bacterium]|nr:class I SAM-dependent methyltransferase [bacterium]